LAVLSGPAHHCLPLYEINTLRCPQTQASDGWEGALSWAAAQAFGSGGKPGQFFEVGVGRAMGPRWKWPRAQSRHLPASPRAAPPRPAETQSSAPHRQKRPSRLPARCALAPPRLTLKVYFGRDARRSELWLCTSGCCASGGCAPRPWGRRGPGRSSAGDGRKRSCRVCARSGTRPGKGVGAGQPPRRELRGPAELRWEPILPGACGYPTLDGAHSSSPGLPSPLCLPPSPQHLGNRKSGWAWHWGGCCWWWPP
jgi:hypothetical protein